MVVDGVAAEHMRAVLALAERYPLRFAVAYGGAKTIAADVLVQKVVEGKQTIDKRRAGVFLVKPSGPGTHLRHRLIALALCPLRFHHPLLVVASGSSLVSFKWVLCSISFT